jgi:hypothetical protein
VPGDGSHQAVRGHTVDVSETARQRHGHNAIPRDVVLRPAHGFLRSWTSMRWVASEA